MLLTRSTAISRVLILSLLPALALSEPVQAAWTQDAKLLASDGAGNDQFGFSVAVSGTTAVVGAYRDDDNGTDSGSAYLFTTSAVIPTPAALPAGLMLLGAMLMRRRRG